MKYIISFTRLFTVLIALLATESIVNAQFGDWTFRQRYALDWTNVTETDQGRGYYQALLFLDTKSYLEEGFMNPDGSDLRFALECEGSNTSLSYWIEPDTIGLENNDSTRVWVLFDNTVWNVVPNATPVGITDLYIYLGNPAAPAISDKDAAFINPLIITEDASVADFGGPNTDAQTIITDEFDRIEIASGVTIDFGPNLGLNNPALWVVKTRLIEVEGRISGEAGGYAGGILGQAGNSSAACAGSEGQGALGQGDPGGGGYGGFGENPATTGGPACQADFGDYNPELVSAGGSGGATLLGFGGASGGGVFLQAANIKLNGTSTINANGENPNGPGTGVNPVSGGAAGGIGLEATIFDISENSFIEARGGIGATVDGQIGTSGGGGLIKIRSYEPSNLPDAVIPQPPFADNSRIRPILEGGLAGGIGSLMVYNSANQIFDFPNPIPPLTRTAPAGPIADRLNPVGTPNRVMEVNDPLFVLSQDANLDFTIRIDNEPLVICATDSLVTQAASGFETYGFEIIELASGMNNIVQSQAVSALADFTIDTKEFDLDGDGTPENPRATGGQYRLRVSAVLGVNNSCSILDSVDFTVQTLPSLQIDRTDSLCFSQINQHIIDGPFKDANPSSVEFRPFVSMTGMPNLADSTSSDKVLLDSSGILIPNNGNPNQSVFYHLYVTDQFGCSDSTNNTTYPSLPEEVYSDGKPFTSPYQIFLFEQNTGIFLREDFCFNEGEYQFKASNPSGLWLGSPGVDITGTGVFNPNTTGVGDFEVYYRLDTALAITDTTGPDAGVTFRQCRNFDTININVKRLIPEFDDICEKDDPFALLVNQFTFPVDTITGKWFSNSGAIARDRDTGIFDPRLALEDSVLIFFDSDSLIAQCHSAGPYFEPIFIKRAPEVEAGGDNGIIEICKGGQLTLGGMPTAKAGTAPFQFQWEPSDTLLSSDTVPNPILKGLLTTTTYTVTLTQANGCTDVDSVQVRVRNATIQVDAGDSLELCFGESVILGGSPTATGGVPSYTYVWSPDSALSRTDVPNPSASPVTDLMYTVSVTDAAGCQIIDSVYVDVLPEFKASAFEVDSIEMCLNDTLRIGDRPTAQGGVPPYSYNWTPTSGLVGSKLANPLVSPQTRVDYEVQVLDGNNCLVSDIVTVIPKAAPDVFAGNDTSFCKQIELTLGGNPTATNGTKPYSFQWTPSANFQTPTSSNPTLRLDSTFTATVTVTDANGCIGVDSILITQFDQPIANAGDEELTCFNSEVAIGGLPTASNGTLPYVFEWEPADLVIDPTAGNTFGRPTTDTTFTLTVTDANGCKGVDSVFIPVIEELKAELIDLPAEVCNERELLEFTVSPGGGTFTGIDVIGGDKKSFSAVTTNVSIPDDGTLRNSVQVQNSGGNIIGKDIFLSSVFINIEHDRISDLKIYLRSPSGRQLTLAERPGIPNVFDVSCDISDITANFIDNPNLPTVEASCIDFETGIVGNFRPMNNSIGSLNDGTSIGTGLWELIIIDDEIGVSGTLKTFTVNFVEPSRIQPNRTFDGIKNIKFTFVDDFGCFNITNQTLTINPTPVANAGGNITGCNSAGIQLGGFPVASNFTGSFTPQWQPVDLFEDELEARENNPTVDLDNDATFSLVVVDAKGCVSKPSVVDVRVKDGPEIEPELLILSSNEVQGNVNAANDNSATTEYRWQFIQDANVSDFIYGESVFYTFPQSGGSIIANVVAIDNLNECESELFELEERLSGTNIHTIEELITISPNPSTGKLNIQTESVIHQATVLSANGRVLHVFEGNSQNQMQLDLSNTSPGVYLIKVKTLNKEHINKILINR